jgi:hypothetical protein
MQKARMNFFRPKDKRKCLEEEENLAAPWNGQSKEPHNRLGFFEPADWAFFDTRLGFLLTRA